MGLRASVVCVCVVTVMLGGKVWASVLSVCSKAHTRTQERSRHLAREEELAEEYERQADLMFSAKNDKLSQATKSRAKRRGRN